MKSTFQTFGKEVCLTDLLMCPVSSAVHREPICCEYQSRFGGRLPVPRAEAALPYWVPQSLRPRKQKPPWIHTLGTTAGGSVAADASSSSGCSSRPCTRTGRWPRGGGQASRPPSCLSASAS
uniref:Uncharacterized protein n=1 Tax=Molossus molossus TaxID=27622 RepID=A0A7J8C5R6_MOLMO|nr:hypothetical protein HJG59_001724 [Molossus molossus]